MKRCPRCMQSYEGDTCPHCRGPLKAVKDGLVGNPVLSSRYAIGAALTQSRQAICYAALDNTTDKPVLVEEFFPRGAVTREGLLVVAKAEFAANFKQALAVEPNGRELTCLDIISTNGTVYRVYQPKEDEDLTTQAEILLDTPVLFRNQDGVPVCSINLLKIPPLPKARKALGSRVAQQKKSKRNMGLLIALALVVIVLGVVAVALGGTPSEEGEENPSALNTEAVVETVSDDVVEEPSAAPTGEVTEEPTEEPTPVPTEEPTPEPTEEPTEEPTPEPTEEPTPEPTEEPTEEPTPEPTDEPTLEPTVEPTATPTPAPTPEYIDLTKNDVDEGDEVYVKNMQEKLAELGFLAEKNISGTYDDATAGAFAAFCERANFDVTEDGAVATEAILKELAISNVQPAKEQVILTIIHEGGQKTEQINVTYPQNSAIEIAQYVPAGYAPETETIELTWDLDEEKGRKLSNRKVTLQCNPREYDITVHMIDTDSGETVKKYDGTVLYSRTYQVPTDDPETVGYNLVDNNNVVTIEWDEKGELIQSEYTVEAKLKEFNVTVEFKRKDGTVLKSMQDQPVKYGEAYILQQADIPNGYTPACESYDLAWANGQLDGSNHIVVVCEADPHDIEIKLIKNGVEQAEMITIKHVPTDEDYDFDDAFLPEGFMFVDGINTVDLNWKDGELQPGDYAIAIEQVPRDLTIAFENAMTGEPVSESKLVKDVAFRQEKIEIELPFGYDAAELKRSGRTAEYEIDWASIEAKDDTITVLCTPWTGKLDIAFEKEDERVYVECDVTYETPEQTIAVSLADLSPEDAQRFVGWEIAEAENAAVTMRFEWKEDGEVQLLDDANIVCQRKSFPVKVDFILDGKLSDEYSYTAERVEYDVLTLNVPEDKLKVPGYTAKSSEVTLSWKDGQLDPEAKVEIQFESWVSQLHIYHVTGEDKLIEKYENPPQIKYSEYPQDSQYKVEVACPIYFTVVSQKDVIVTLNWQDGELVNESIRISCTPWQAKVKLCFVDEVTEKPVWDVIELDDLICGETGVSVVDVQAELEKMLMSTDLKYERAEGVPEKVELTFADEDGKLNTTDMLTGSKQEGYVLTVKLAEVKEESVPVAFCVEGELVPVKAEIWVLADGSEDGKAAEKVEALPVFAGLEIDGELTIEREMGTPKELTVNCKLADAYEPWTKGQEQQSAVIARAQQRLKELGYYGSDEVPITGVYDEAMAKALHLFCLVNMKDAVTVDAKEGVTGLDTLTREMLQRLLDDAAETAPKKIADIIAIDSVRIGQKLDKLDAITKDATVTALAGDGAGMYEPRWEDVSQEWFLAANTQWVDHDALETKYNYQTVEPWQACWALMTDAEANYIVQLTHKHDGAIYLSKLDFNQSEAQITQFREMLRIICKQDSRGARLLTMIQTEGSLTDQEIGLMVFYAKSGYAFSCDCLYPDQLEALRQKVEQAEQSGLNNGNPDGTKNSDGESLTGNAETIDNTDNTSNDDDEVSGEDVSVNGEVGDGAENPDSNDGDAVIPPEDINTLTRNFFHTNSNMVGTLGNGDDDPLDGNERNKSN